MSGNEQAMAAPNINDLEVPTQLDQRRSITRVLELGHRASSRPIRTLPAPTRFLVLTNSECRVRDDGLLTPTPHRAFTAAADALIASGLTPPVASGTLRR
jgi:hypothetical protein